MDSKTFVIHLAIRKREEMAMDPDRRAQIKAQSKAQIQNKAQVRALLFDEAPIEVLAEYSDYRDVFSAENAAELPEINGINEYAIKLEEGKYLLFGPIYSLGPVK